VNPLLTTVIQGKLEAQDVLLHYYIVEGVWQAVLVTNSTTRLVANLAPAATVDRLMRAWRFYLQHGATGEQDPTTAHPYLTRLYQALIAPLQAQLTGRNRLYLVLPPEWHDLPLPALFDGAHYLVEQFELVYLSTAGALATLAPQHLALSTGLAQSSAVVVGYSDNTRLPHAVHEARLVKSALVGATNTNLLLEEEAMLNDFRYLARTSGLLHLATHALFRPDNPNFSSIQLADGRITVADLYAMTLPGRPFVVLSACETGRGRPRGGGLLGMGRGFLAAGAAGLVATLWPVSDTASAGLIADFYHAWLASPAQPATALHAAQLAAIAQRHPPFYWSGFVFIGG
jgi:CHAT domain-containing protein